MKSKGTVVPTLSSASNHAIVRHYSRYWPSPRGTAATAQACGAVHCTLCSRSNCCHTCCAVMTTQPYTSSHHSLGRESDLNQQAGRQVSNEFQSLSPMGSHILSSWHAGSNLCRTLPSSYTVRWPQSIVLQRETFSSCTNQATQLGKWSFHSIKFNLVLSKLSNTYQWHRTSSHPTSYILCTALATARGS